MPEVSSTQKKAFSPAGPGNFESRKDANGVLRWFPKMEPKTVKVDHPEISGNGRWEDRVVLDADGKPIMEPNRAAVETILKEHDRDTAGQIIDTPEGAAVVAKGKQTVTFPEPEKPVVVVQAAPSANDEQLAKLTALVEKQAEQIKELAAAKKPGRAKKETKEE